MKLVHTLLLACSFLSAPAQLVSLNAGELQQLKQLVTADSQAAQRYQALVAVADASLTARPAPVVTISSEGRLKGDPVKTATMEAVKDFKKIYALAIVYSLSGDSKYLDAVSTYLTSWATVNQPSGNPINDTNLDDAIEAYDLVKSKLSKADRRQVEGWLQRTATAQISNKHQIEGTNWNSHRLKVVGEVAYAINNKDLKKWTLKNIAPQLAKNLNADGTSFDFKSRDAVNYHVYDLEPLLELAIVLQRATGKDYYSLLSASGSSIKKSVDWLVPYVSGEKTHAEYVNTTIRFDIDRARNNEANHAIGSTFKATNGIKALLLAAHFEPGLLPVAMKAKGAASPYFDWVGVLNAVRK